MAVPADNDSALVQRANLNIAAAVVAKLGAGAPDSLIGHVINDVRANRSVAELASAGGMSSVLGAVETAIARNTDASRPFNVTDSRAAQLAAHGGPHGGHWHHDGAAFGRYGLLGLGRGSREAANEGGDGSPGHGSSGASRGSGSYAAINGTGSEPAGAAFWGTAKGMMLTRGYANDNGMNWAPPDLMQMGRPALQTLKESGLKGDGYKALHAPSGLHLDNPAILSGAGYMKRSRLNYNEAAKAGAAVYTHPSMTPEDKRDWRSSLDRSKHPEGATGDEAYRQGIRRSGTHLKEQHPEMTPQVDEALKKYGADKGAGLDAKAAAAGAGPTAKKDEAGAKQDDAAAKQKGAAADAKDAKNDDASTKLAELLKKRQAAASTPKPSG